jgi:anaerobic ribonucleoside-triphosphate reductase activating protein
VSELTWILDPDTGDLLVEALSAEEASPLVGDLLPPGRELFCAVPLALLHLRPASSEEIAHSTCVRIAGFYHHSVIEGPGRRSTVKMQGCTTACRGCIAQETWNLQGGYLVPVERLADALLDPTVPRDGATILGGEPFLQPEGLWALVQALRARSCPHILVYSGYTYERLQRMAQRRSAIAAVLNDVDTLVDGPYVAALADRAGPWMGSGNQRVIDLVATRRRGHIVLIRPGQHCES